MYKIVGHRGLPEYYPENSLLGMLGAVAAGADALELDVQFSKDGVPFLCHDGTLERVAGVSKYIWDVSSEDLVTISCGERSRFGDRYQAETFCSLERLSAALSHFQGEIFIEVKAESFAVFDRKFCLEQVLKASQLIHCQRRIISFDDELVRLAAATDLAVGLVVKAINSEVIALLASLLRSPKQNGVDSYLAFPKAALMTSSTEPEATRFDGKLASDETRGLIKSALDQSLSLFVYDITDPHEARELHRLGISYIESWNAYALLQPTS